MALLLLMDGLRLVPSREESPRALNMLTELLLMLLIQLLLLLFLPRPPAGYALA